MTELWTARPHPTFLPRTLALCLTASLAGVSGCGGERAVEPTAAANPDPAPYRPLLEPLPPPAVDRIKYKAETRTLYFPDLPRSGQWLVKVPGAWGEAAAGTDHVVPPGADPSNTFVYYRRPGGQVSGRVSLSQIQAAAREHDSQIR